MAENKIDTPTAFLIETLCDNGKWELSWLNVHAENAVGDEIYGVGKAGGNTHTKVWCDQTLRSAAKLDPEYRDEDYRIVQADPVIAALLDRKNRMHQSLTKKSKKN